MKYVNLDSSGQSLIMAEFELQKEYQFQDTILLANIYNELGIVYYELDNNSKDLHLLNKDRDYYLKASKTNRSTVMNAKALNNIGNSYLLEGKFQEALKEFRKSWAIERELPSKSLQSSSLNNMGLVYYHTGQYDSAYACFSKAITLLLHNEAKNEFEINNWIQGNTIDYFLTSYNYLDSLSQIDAGNYQLPHAEISSHLLRMVSRQQAIPMPPQQSSSVLRISCSRKRKSVWEKLESKKWL